MNIETKNKIDEIIKNNEVVLFMKGNSEVPRCGFSQTACFILDNLGIDYLDVNVLEDEEIRQGIKEFSDWPTIPQLYVKGEFIGGCDIMREMYETGELKEVFNKS